ncbi:MAG: hypothetical protein JKY37_24920 [Nannocystaceae bacterium]|nr:hypothetical protein [Nannocystaceae bacterium]
MRLRKFRAASMREALAQVRRELGKDALIVATKPVRSGLLKEQIEVTAAIDEDEPEAAISMAFGERAPARAPVPSLSDEDIEKVMAPMRSELRSLRGFVRTLAGQRRPDSKLKDEIVSLQRTVMSIAARHGVADETELATLARGKHLCKSSKARVVVMVGPTGVGKTTTIAKLAARAALIQRKSVHIISLDTYRVGATAQIRSFGKLMDVPVTVAANPEEQMNDALNQARRADLVLVDTAGRSIRDLRAPKRIEAALATLPRPEVHLAIAAGTSRFDIDTIVARYAPLGVNRLVFTKVDETGDLAELIRAPTRLDIPVSYITTGQRVPEDLEDADQERLLMLAMQGFELAEVA